MNRGPLTEKAQRRLPYVVLQLYSCDFLYITIVPLCKITQLYELQSAMNDDYDCLEKEEDIAESGNWDR